MGGDPEAASASRTIGSPLRRRARTVEPLLAAAAGRTRQIACHAPPARATTVRKSSRKAEPANSVAAASSFTSPPPKAPAASASAPEKHANGAGHGKRQVAHDERPEARCAKAQTRKAPTIATDSGWRCARAQPASPPQAAAGRRRSGSRTELARTEAFSPINPRHRTAPR